MKKFYIAAFIFIFCTCLFSVIGGKMQNSENETNITTTSSKTYPTKTPIIWETNPPEVPNQEKDKQTKNNTTAKNPTKPKKKSNYSKLFEKIYMPLATREKPFLFKSVSTFIKNEDFEYKITKPSKNNTGKIKVFSENGDYVNITFHPVPDLDNIECIMTISYYNKKDDKEVSLSNYSSDNAASNDVLNTHTIGKTAKEVSSVEKQRKFIFSD